ncbi:MAG: hypothetical protein AUJ52_00090 [Elusimicrobia bacterium CG1_02_63_36]|nr:MAG: hypothetical protein AUJ52_00090 [Elusimicrobia bacterium CG1_02_63_36]PIP83998.1 MAG: hypothetical protein COR54_06445 [Elusimicrobia bacterium CG22_combo_CG10-13_8_21_14_all_63_91]PJA13578.1 MAG: hypothetical protein COX66_14535 [Elusimicrobia bacterium CG_4_10_14_0_2_um_filter_63_34]PJB23948.1 MAG: hypothetical protein CO113_16270 [Elusimicrobia bacterium CG_4_9_14_3_um_filter_62_55]
MRVLSALLALAFAVSGVGASEIGVLGTLSNSAQDAASQSDAGASKRRASDGWDSLRGEEYVSPPLVPEPAGGYLKKPSANLFVGNPGQDYVKSEPESPLTKDDKPKKQGSGAKLWWGLGGAALGAGLGFLLFGPIGALIGGLAAGAAGFYFAP